ncbi:GntR family transcriptional regulator [Zhihengliuella halotolerans]|uniref:GntR family transcriptional regulator n=1 Tax=Zhihengliuella halotolerans TaxID=370736 RepID=UPI000C80D139|nr:GntR family transcriptional regulator [Zhihengliuella halotolerans]
MNGIARKAAPTAPETAYLWLREQITALPWDQEAFLSENAIAESAGVSRTPVREALLRLEAVGLLRRVPHKGAYVPALTSQDIRELIEVRRVIGSWAVRKVTAHGLIRREVLDAIIADQAGLLDDPVAFIEADIRFHKAIVHAAGNPTLAGVYDSQRFKQARLGVQAILETRSRVEQVLDEHRAMVDAIASGDPDEAVAASARHLESTRSALREGSTDSLDI